MVGFIGRGIGREAQHRPWRAVDAAARGHHHPTYAHHYTGARAILYAFILLHHTSISPGV